MKQLGQKWVLPEVVAFEWDEGNLTKNRLKHDVAPTECEQIFFNKSLMVHEDLVHSHTEERMQALGETNQKRKLFIAFTLRTGKIRIISARDQNKKERIFYEKQRKTA